MREISPLLRKAWKRRVSLRLVSLKLANLYDGRFRSVLALDASARQHDAQQRLADVVDALREKYGRGVLLRGHDFILCAKGGAERHGRRTPAQASVSARLSRLGVGSPAFTPASTPQRQDNVHTATGPAYQLAEVQWQRLGNSIARLPL